MFAIKHISSSSKKHLLLLNIQININFQSRFVVRNSNKNKLNKLIRFNHLQCLKKQDIIVTTNFTAINTLVVQQN